MGSMRITMIILPDGRFGRRAFPDVALSVVIGPPLPLEASYGGLYDRSRSSGNFACH